MTFIKVSTIFFFLIVSSSVFSQHFYGPFNNSNEQFKPYYESFLKEGEKPLRFWYHYMVSYHEKEGRYILRLFQPEKGIILSETRYKDKKLKIKDGLNITLNYQNRYVTAGNFVGGKEDGKWVQLDTLDHLRAIKYYSQGLKEGKWTYFFDNKQVKKSEYYLHDEPLGTWVEYHENGKIKEVTPFIENEIHGEVNSYDSTGSLISTTIYERGEEIKTIYQENLYNRVTESNISSDLEIFKTADHAPRFSADCSKHKTEEEENKCHTSALYRFIGEHSRYPADAQRLDVAGKIFLKFVIEKDGSVGEVVPLTGLCESLEEEAIRVIKSMPNWEPGIINGKPVRVYYTMPFVYKLE